MTRSRPRGVKSVTVPASAKLKVKRRAPSASSLSGLFHRATTILTRPLPFALVLVAGVLYLTHLEGEAERNFVHKLATKLNTVSFLKPVAKWVSSNAVHVVGLACFSIPVFSVIPSRDRILFMLCCVLYVMLVPQAAALDYVWQAGLLFCWQLARTSNSRVSITLIGVIGYVLEWYTFKFR